MILNRLAEDLGELAAVEQRPQQDGRNMTMMLAPAGIATEDGDASAEDKKSEERAKPRQSPAGSAQPADTDPPQI